MKKEQIFYKEGIIKLIPYNEHLSFDFKSCRQLFSDDSIFEIIDIYDNKIRIPYKNVLYIMYFSHNKRKK